MMQIIEIYVHGRRNLEGNDEMRRGAVTVSQNPSDLFGVSVTIEAERCKATLGSAKSFPFNDMKGKVPKIIAFHLWTPLIHFVDCIDYSSDSLFNKDGSWLCSEWKDEQGWKLSSCVDIVPIPSPNLQADRGAGNSDVSSTTAHPQVYTLTLGGPPLEED
jgi:hypothetical protein